MWPTWSKSKQPLANAMDRPSARSRATAATSSLSLSTPKSLAPDASPRPFLRPVLHGRVVVAFHGVAQLPRRNRRGPAFHHDQAARIIREARRFIKRRPGCERERHCRDHRVAGAGDVGHLSGTEDWDVD